MPSPLKLRSTSIATFKRDQINYSCKERLESDRIPVVCFTNTLVQRYGTVTIFYGSGSGSDFGKVMVPVPVPTYEKLRFRFHI
jgi:hypothetical protein